MLIILNLSFHVKSAFLNIYKNKDFIDKYHNDIIQYLKNYGLVFNKDNNLIFLNDKQYLVPNKPNIDKNLDLENNILFSKYFVK